MNAFWNLAVATAVTVAAEDLSRTGRTTCPEGYILLGTSCYFVSQDTHSGASAENFCQGYGGHAAVIETSEEMDLLKDSLLDRTVHLGVTASTSQEQLYECSLKLNEHSGYTNFHTGEPNNHGGEDCVVAASAFDFAWNDVQCTEARHVLCKTEATVTAPSCPDGAHLFQDSACFWMDESAAYTWAGAQSACTDRGMHLASVKSQAEQDFISGLDPNIMWIGLNDQMEEGVYIWSDGTAVDYTNWNDGEPNGGDAHNCGYMSGYVDGEWGDWSCDYLMGVVCRGVPN